MAQCQIKQLRLHAETTKLKRIGAGIAADIVAVQVQFGRSLFFETDAWKTRGEFRYFDALDGCRNGRPSPDRHAGLIRVPASSLTNHRNLSYETGHSVVERFAAAPGIL